jgi:CRP-like cAMP-binding protein
VRDPLDRFPLLEELSRNERRVLLPYLAERRYDAGRRLFRSGEEAEQLLFLLEGEARVELKRHVLCTVGAGEMIGGLSLLVVGRRRCDVYAQETVRALALERSAYLRLRREAPTIALVIQEAVLRGFVRSVAATEVANPTEEQLTAVDGSETAE